MNMSWTETGSKFRQCHWADYCTEEIICIKTFADLVLLLGFLNFKNKHVHKTGRRLYESVFPPPLTTDLSCSSPSEFCRRVEGSGKGPARHFRLRQAYWLRIAEFCGEYACIVVNVKDMCIPPPMEDY